MAPAPWSAKNVARPKGLPVFTTQYSQRTLHADSAAETRRWLLPLTGDATAPAGAKATDAKTTMVCFPFAGGGSSSFRTWRSIAAARDICLAAVQYPGREVRWGEPPAASLGDMADDIAAAISALRTDSLLLVGHSFGALVALETARRLVSAGDTRLVRLVVAGARAPNSPCPDSLHRLPDAQFLAKVAAFGGLPEAVRDSEELMALALPVMRADFRLMEMHAETHADAATAALPVALSVLGGRNDAHVPCATLFGWQAETCRSARLRLFDGGHFFPFESSANVLDAIIEDLAATSVMGTS